MSTMEEQSLKEELLAMDRRHLWHHMSPHNDHPVIFAEGQGSWVTDVEGNRYLDGMSGLWCVNVGHGREEIALRAFEQMKTIAYTPLMQSHLPAIRLAEKLSGWIGGPEYRIFFSNSGSEANEVAFKIARQYHHQNGEPTRHKFISRHRAYHGNSMGALAATGQAQRKRKYEPLGMGFQHVPPPYCYRCPFGQSPESCRLECARAIEDAIVWEGAETVAGVIMEPAITGGGVIVPPSGYLPAIREICDKHGVLLIIDEVITGFGRSGERLGHHNYGITADIVTMAKGLTSAYAPLSATAVRAELYEAFRGAGDDTHFRHVNTFGGNPVSCAVALQNLEILEREGLVERAAELGEGLRLRLAGLAEHPHVGDLRFFGFIAGIELVEDRASKEPASADKVMKVLSFCRSRGVILGKNGDTVPGYANIVTAAPPFVTTEAELDLIAGTLREALESL
ncbi:aspartate aminotransferase family protein [Paenibacillus mucilaginosus]|uniref:YhxA n=1 Tax=Paenibacillus mucilaginosus (strain KNP414) TaxID=1036673 RepID=F8F847_PAEMK|nr:aspartate aminotransferase family protein [Paenibacillus mucilaginosus]AEI41032.1 YhxA [Paenibacillus mucilaginosus KNP414]MCG7211526.1 aspartate aminotransferase family protein [Paenibacillus mucilaginosus]WDM30100.1 aspartate aminotransferase family protein [Paenibacillus mucilaginosus]